MPRRVSELTALKREFERSRSIQRRTYLLRRIRELEAQKRRHP